MLERQGRLRQISIHEDEHLAVLGIVDDLFDAADRVRPVRFDGARFLKRHSLGVISVLQNNVGWQIARGFPGVSTRSNVVSPMTRTPSRGSF